MRIPSLHLKSFIEYAGIRNIPQRELLQVMQDPPADLLAPGSSVDVSDFYNIVGLMATRLDDELLGLRVGSFINLIHLGIIYQLSLKSTTVEEALFYCQSYYRQTFPVAQFDTYTSGQLYTIEISALNDHDRLNRIILENVLTLVGREIRVIAGADTGLKIFSPYHGVSYPVPWAKGKSFALTFAQSVLKAGLQDNSHWGLDALIPEYVKIIATLDAGQSFSNKVKLVALNMSKPRLPDLETIAGAFNLTPRTLQRRLAAEGATFREINEGLKREICNLLIRNDRFSVLELSDILGYSEPAAFIHSFRKWYGASPQMVRKKSHL